MADLFAASRAKNVARAAPLAARMRPRRLADYVGQGHVVGEGKLLRRLIEADRLGSVILYGPPGVGKTTLAEIIASETSRRFVELSATASGVKDLREVLEAARRRLEDDGQKTCVFIDEIHRFNKAQQDVLLPDVESGVIALVGATTHNPFFALTSALVSRSRIFELQALRDEDIAEVLRRAVRNREHGFGSEEISLTDEALAFLVETCDGDARRALGGLEVGVLSAKERPLAFTLELARESVQRKAMVYDAGDTHYDCASALIKSIRGSDVDAGLYWLARMLEGGEDVMFLARRLVILASEDVGNADPQALMLATAAMQATQFVGLPECQLTLSQAVIYLALAPKSNACTTAIGAARRDVREKQLIPVPRHLQDKHYAGAKRLGRGEGYAYAHNAPDAIASQDYLGVEKTYYEPTDRGLERQLAERLAEIRRRLRSERPEADSDSRGGGDDGRE
ncbi:MAG: replication-associated recombination protein A [Planctomycetota bacterium]|nr:replication-associated recombination protein A [Planctomycetota bacterium]MDA0969121.1 replication-associated recombination protein A [Planctomycetota bacterium]